MSTSGLKAIAPVPKASDFLDIVLSKTQRKTPTVIHKNFKISRIRNFYMRKVKFTQDSFDEKLGAILEEFPIIDMRPRPFVSVYIGYFCSRMCAIRVASPADACDSSSLETRRDGITYIAKPPAQPCTARTQDLHPFLSSLLNVLYDKNHYKLALGQLRTARHLIDQVAKDYVRLLKFGDSLYRCKQLKRAALGRMATIMRRQNEALEFLEEVRKHISRLPAIDPTARTLLICGYPNVGKSSFLNKVTRADVDVQPYAFTTKSLFVGHLDYRYMRWQVIDTPGILDHPLEEMNNIEMQSITALAHLKACVLYFMDLSEQCGYSVEAQCQLFNAIKPLFANKPTVVVLNKADVSRLEDLAPERRAAVEEVINGEGVRHVQVSCYTDEGVTVLKTTACDALLEHRVDTKLKGNKVNAILNRLHVAQPKARDDVVRAPFIPDAVKGRKKYDRDDPERRRLQRDVEAEEGGAGVYNINLKTNYFLENEEWKNDTIPEIMDGKNIADFIDPDILERLDALEREEEKLEAEGFYDTESDMFDSDDEREAVAAKTAREKKVVSQGTKKAMKNRAVLPRTAGLRTLSELTTGMTKAGLDPSRIQARAEMLAKVAGAKRKRQREEEEEAQMDVDEDEDEDADVEGEEEWMDVDGEEAPRLKRAKANSGDVVDKGTRHPRSNRQLAGMRDNAQVSKAIKLRNLGQRERNMHARAGESDRAIKVKMPKHLFSGKRKGGKTDRR